MTRRRGFARPSSLISLLDVLFILMFASLAQTRALMEREAARPAVDAAADAGPVAAAPDDAGPAQDAARSDGVGAQRLRTRAYEAVLSEAQQRESVFARITGDGELAWVERVKRGRRAVGVPLVERVDDPDIALVYRGEADPALRVCSLVRAALDVSSLEAYLVIMVVELPVPEMQVALVRGLERESRWCRRDQDGLAVLVTGEADDGR
jgi:hypothetical protein